MKFIKTFFVPAVGVGLCLYPLAVQAKVTRAALGDQKAAGVFAGVAVGIPGGILRGILRGGTMTSASPAPQATAPERIRVAGDVEEAKLISRPDPDYSGLVKLANIQGNVRLAVLVSKDGKIQGLKAISGHPMLVDVALRAVSQSRYQPTLLNGEPVEVVTEVDVKFSQVGVDFPLAPMKVTVTGCLQKGGDPNEFQLTVSGKSYDLMSTSTVALQDHLGHKVKVTGSDVTKTLSATEQGEGVAGHLQVTKLKEVSKACP